MEDKKKLAMTQQHITNPELGSLLTVHGKLSNDMANDPMAFMTADQILQQSRENTNEDIGSWH